MAEALRFFSDYEPIIYFLLGFSMVIYGFQFARAWRENREAIYKLEQESSRQRLNRSAISMFVLLVMGFVIFVLVTFISPVISPDIVLPISSPVPEITAAGTESPAAVVGATENLLSTATPLPTVSIVTEGCVKGELMILSPEAGEAISGEIPVIGTVNITNLGFYKFEVAQKSQELWLTYQAGRGIVINDILVESLDTTQFPPGEYVLQLVATTSDGSVLPPCRVPVTIGAAP
ncbi:MAG: hypothetical protein OEY93_07700 [Anaerolineae bacterium]|nr:hypothetical protein [Anaerolineae bacterium]